MKARSTILVIAVLVLLGGSLGYVLHARQRGGEHQLVAAESSFTLNEPGLYYRDTATGRVARSPGTADGPASGTPDGPSCARFYAAGDRALCLRALPGIPARTQAVVYDRRFTELQTVTVPGIPNRARVSASGQLLSWTTFAVGDSYAASGFSTRTSVLDLRTGYLVKSIESIPLTVGDTRYHAADVNYWGVNFADDDNRFYATVSTGGQTHLVEGDLRAWSARTLRENVECPSLSPDGTRIAFKKKVSADPAAPWQLFVLELAGMREHPLAESRSVDDQAAWLDGETLGYALPGRDGKGSDIWTVPADGGGAPHLLVPGGSSPVAVPAATSTQRG
ncbi:TolB family protein [Kitasatospora sp. NPDC058170]|uniref:TolB family protein n=1 Tax=Kitasatospora sp. NPDC058170 TaxID=3346364 RepID=UPI0036DD5889